MAFAGSSIRTAKAWAALGLAATAGAGFLAGCASAPLKPMATATRPACTDVVFPIYFAEGSDQLTSTAGQVIGSASSQTDKGRPVPLRRKTEVVIHALPS